MIIHNILNESEFSTFSAVNGACVLIPQISPSYTLKDDLLSNKLHVHMQNFCCKKNKSHFLNILSQLLEIEVYLLYYLWLWLVVIINTSTPVYVVNEYYQLLKGVS